MFMGSDREIYPMCRFLKKARVDLVAALIFLSPTPSASAQQAGSIVGSVMDQMTLAPLVGASVSVMDHELSAVTNQDGHFSIQGVPTGDVSVRMEHLGHIGIVVQVAIIAQEVAFVQAELSPIGLLLDELRVITERDAEDRGGAAVSEFRPTEAESSYTAMELLRARVPSLLVWGGEQQAGQRTHIQIRGGGSVLYSVQPSLYIDGVKTDLDFLTELPSTDIRRIRVLRGPSASALYQDSVNGVILVDTWRGTLPGARPPGPPPP